MIATVAVRSTSARSSEMALPSSEFPTHQENQTSIFSNPGGEVPCSLKSGGKDR